ncbi:MAG TPA: GAF domain-containing SpoIIE family protein phosphatase [Vicinamibacterales bacterium]|nr:GAF domain-containing SpoIIE family protein phosphatase [Vicinamibacterales bacterium]
MSDPHLTRTPPADGVAPASDSALLLTLFELGREVTSVLDLDELLEKIPQLIARLTEFSAFAVYLLDEKLGDLRIAYSVGYPEETRRSLRVKLGEGIVGTAAERGEAMRVGDVTGDPRYVDAVPGTRSELVVPLRRKKRVIGALNLLSSKPGQFTDRDEAILRQFGAHVAVALENARLFDRERQYSATLETLAEIGQEVASILDLNELLERIAVLARRLIDYRTFGILLLNEAAGELEMKLAIRYGNKLSLPTVKLGAGIVGYAALHKEAVLVPDVSIEPRYIPVVEDCRSELAIPMLLKDRCIGVFDLESPELNAFTKEHVEIMTLLASQAAGAIENARLYEEVRSNELRIERELTFAQRVQAALLPTSIPKRLRGIDVAARFAPARELGGDLHDFLSPEANSLVVAVGDVSGKGVPAALYSAFAGELVRSRTFRRRYTPERTTPAGVLGAMNTILHERGLEEYYCTLTYASFDLKRRSVTLANAALPYPIRCSADGCAQIHLPGIPLGSFAGAAYDEVTFEFSAGDTYVFCTDGVSEAFSRAGEEFGTDRLLEVVRARRDSTATEIVDAIFDAVHVFRGDRAQSDDMTAVAVRITS